MIQHRTRETQGRCLSVATGNIHKAAEPAPDLVGPVGLDPAPAVEQPGEHAMPGSSRFELKWDGFLH